MTRPGLKKTSSRKLKYLEDATRLLPNFCAQEQHIHYSIEAYQPWHDHKVFDQRYKRRLRSRQNGLTIFASAD